MAMNKTNASHFLKRTYPKKTRDIQATRKGKLWAMIPRSTEGFGESYDVGMEYGGLVGVGADFTKARNRSIATGASGSKFAVTEKSFYSFAHIDGNLMRKAKAGSEGMIKDRLVKASERAFEAFNHRMSRYCYGDGYTPLGVISSDTTLASTVIVLTRPEDAINFKVNDVLFLAPDASTSAARNSGATVTVSKVDRNLGRLTITTTLSTTIAAAAAGDLIFVDGDRGTGAAPTRLQPLGVDGWNPFTAPGGSDSFFGVNRSNDEVRLAGWRMGGLNKTERQATLEALYQVQNDGAEFVTFVMHPKRMREIAKDIEGNKFWSSVDLPSAVAGISIKGAKWMTEWGEVTMIADPYCPSNIIRGMDLSTWSYRSEGPMPDFLTFDDGNLITIEASDQGELRVGGDFELVCEHPPANIVIDMDQA